MFKVTIFDINRQSVSFDEESSCVVLPAEGGEISIMDFHQPIVSKLKRGIIKIDGKKFYNISSGLAAMDGNTLKLLIKTV